MEVTAPSRSPTTSSSSSDFKEDRGLRSETWEARRSASFYSSCRSLPVQPGRSQRMEGAKHLDSADAASRLCSYTQTRGKAPTRTQRPL